MTLEHPEKFRNEHFTFTLTNEGGQRFYGICMRGHFRGEGRRYDVKRRTRHCLCIITKHRYFSMYRTLLLQVHALTLLEQHPGTARKFLEIIHTQDLSSSNVQTVTLASARESMSKLQAEGNSLIASNGLLVTQLQLPELCRDFTLNPSQINTEINILPLLDVLGVEKFCLLLSGILCERRVIFIAETVDVLSSSVLAAASMLYPFTWQHIFIPLVPSRLKSYACAPMPYLIGVRKYLLPSLEREGENQILNKHVGIQLKRLFRRGGRCHFCGL
jgi:hypothetical protein